MTAAFFRLFGTVSEDHLFTTSTWEVRLATQNTGYSSEGTAAFISPVARTGLVAELLADCPGLALLVTSRIALRLRAECRVHVGPLATPVGEGISLDEAATAPAVQLFVQRAQAAAPGFVLDPSNATVVAAICRRLAGCH